VPKKNKRRIAKKKQGKGRTSARKARHRRKARPRIFSARIENGALDLAALERKGLGPDAAGQAGDIEGLSSLAGPGSESIAELVEEGQDFEAEVVSGVQNARDADTPEVGAEEEETETEEIFEDDIPLEYENEQ
jgi:hypothetical protein